LCAFQSDRWQLREQYHALRHREHLSVAAVSVDRHLAQRRAEDCSTGRSNGRSTGHFSQTRAGRGSGGGVAVVASEGGGFVVGGRGPAIAGEGVGIAGGCEGGGGGPATAGAGVGIDGGAGGGGGPASIRASPRLHWLQR
jgi:hypothetical protein